MLIKSSTSDSGLSCSAVLSPPRSKSTGGLGGVTSAKAGSAAGIGADPGGAVAGFASTKGAGSAIGGIGAEHSGVGGGSDLIGIGAEPSGDTGAGERIGSGTGSDCSRRSCSGRGVEGIASCACHEQATRGACAKRRTYIMKTGAPATG